MRTSGIASPRPRWDTWLWLGAIAAVNLSLLTGTPATWAIFRPEAVAGGEWWRILSHPLAHASLYHLLLDAGAFFMLYAGLKHSTGWRTACTLACGAGSLLGAMASPAVVASGFCGLSGIGHGLMAVTGIELLATHAASGRERIIGSVVLGLVVLKCIYEALSGHVFFAAGHVGDVGTPLVLCHAGGVIGGLVYVILNRVREHK